MNRLAHSRVKIYQDKRKSRLTKNKHVKKKVCAETRWLQMENYEDSCTVSGKKTKKIKKTILKFFKFDEPTSAKHF